MTVLPSQKLTISQVFLSLAAGLMLFLLPNDAKNQIVEEGPGEAYIFLISLVISSVLFIITKRYEAVGLSLFTMALLNAISFFFEIVIGFSEDSPDYWPDLNKYRVLGCFLLWFVPFMFCIVIRVLATGSRDNNDTRRDFAGFMSSGIKSLLILYVVIIVFKLIMPSRPGQENRELVLMIFERIGGCINGSIENGFSYICWHCIVLAPLSFYLAVLVPKFKIWHVAIISAILGIAIEVMQYILATASACTDDILMLMVGALLGILIKHGINKLRSVITKGEDNNMLSFEYSHLDIKPKGEAQVLTED